MLGNKRNPFPRIGKIYKYEFINISKILLPLYLLLIILGLLIGLTSNTNKIKNFLDSESPILDEEDSYLSEPDLPLIPKDDYDLQKKSNQAHQISYNPDNSNNIQTVQYFHYESSSPISLTKIFAGFFVIAFYIFIQIILLVTFIIFGRRFRKTMFGEEAYLNLSLPVTIGEHLWGRFLCYFTWIIICFVTLIFSGLLSLVKFLTLDMIKEAFTTINNVIIKNQGNPVSIYLSFLLVAVSLSVLIITFSFFINTITSLYKKHTTLLKIISIVVTLSIIGKVFSLTLSYSDFNSLTAFTNSMWKTTLIYLGFSTIFMTSTHLILSTKLNLE